MDDAVGDELMRWRRRRGSLAMAESGEVVAEAAGQASTGDSACSKEGRAVELLDTVARRGDDGERELHGGAGAAASAMVRGSEGEELGRKRHVCGLGEKWVTNPGHQNDEGRRQGGGQLRGARSCRR